MVQQDTIRPHTNSHLKAGLCSPSRRKESSKQAEASEIPLLPLIKAPQTYQANSHNIQRGPDADQQRPGTCCFLLSWFCRLWSPGVHEASGSHIPLSPLPRGSPSSDRRDLVKASNISYLSLRPNVWLWVFVSISIEQNIFFKKETDCIFISFKFLLKVHSSSADGSRSRWRYKNRWWIYFQ